MYHFIKLELSMKWITKAQVYKQNNLTFEDDFVFRYMHRQADTRILPSPPPSTKVHQVCVQGGLGFGQTGLDIITYFGVWSLLIYIVHFKLNDFLIHCISFSMTSCLLHDIIPVIITNVFMLFKLDSAFTINEIYHIKI